ncbi:hypothetical protein V6N12_028499 [Hibiscus sabdariffa]|uniref:CCHC-type domain-containing protein n=1 Tax=Hibiscus sabdariffa TaxID=183260 RepID=A0ABR2F636_9ROSI
MTIKINLKQPLVSKIVINSCTQIVEYESLPVVCFTCGIYGHVSEHCPNSHPQEPLLESETTMVDIAVPQPPLDPYGPWMLFENRRQRPTKPTTHPTRSATVPIVSHSRYNLIFVDFEPIDQPVILEDNHASDLNPQINPPSPHIVAQQVAIAAGPSSTLDPSSSSGKSKSKSKALVTLRKAPLTVLKSRDTNIMPKKVGGTGPARKSSLNPAKHSVHVTSESAPPIVLGQFAARPTSSFDNSGTLSHRPRMVALDGSPVSHTATARKISAGPMAMQQ